MNIIFIFLAMIGFINLRADCELNDLNSHRAQNYYCSMIYNLEKAQQYLCMEQYENALLYYHLSSCACFDDDGVYRFKIDMGILLAQCMMDEDENRLSVGLTKVYNQHFRPQLGRARYAENGCDQ